MAVPRAISRWKQDAQGGCGALLIGALLVGSLLAAAGLPACRTRPPEPEPRRLVATMPGEPRSLNRFVSARPAENLIALFTQATLVRVNRATGELEPRLAREWSLAPDGRTYTLRLEEADFSDGRPFTAHDVVFTFEVLYDPRTASQLTSSFQVDGRPLEARAVDDRTIQITFPSLYGPGLAILDSLPILPRHKLQNAFETGTFAEAWEVDTPVTEIVGLGPFVLTEYMPGQHLRFVRNPRFWRQPLPYLDEIELQIVPERNAELLRLQSGEADVIFDFVPAEALAAMRQAEAAGTVRLVDAGIEITADALWFNLASGAPRAAAGRAWLQREELRHAISSAVDRQAIVDTVHLGAAAPVYGPIAPGHGEWYVSDLPRPARDVAKARALLASIGLGDRDGDRVLEDAAGRDARFTLLTTKGNALRERTSSMLQDQLRQVGLLVDVVPLDIAQLVSRWEKGDYDAIYFGVTYDSFDPARNLEYWMSSGSFHLWNPGQQEPATSWEARIDDLMRQQSTTLDPVERRRLFRDVQMIFAEHLPCIYFAAAKATVATSARVTGVMPSVLKPPVLWNAEALSVDSHARR